MLSGGQLNVFISPFFVLCIFFWVYEYRKGRDYHDPDTTANKRTMLKSNHDRKLGSLEGVRLLLPSYSSSSVNGMSLVCVCSVCIAEEFYLYMFSSLTRSNYALFHLLAVLLDLH